MSTGLNMSEWAMGSEYSLKCIYMSDYAKILNMPESTEIYLDVGKYT